MVGIHMQGVGASGIKFPQQFQHQHPMLARLQPGVQLGQQPACAKQQGRCILHTGGQLQRSVKHFRQVHPGIDLGRTAIGPVQRIDHCPTEASRHAPTGQRPQLAPGGAAQTQQRRHMLPCNCHGLQGQGIRMRIRRSTPQTPQRYQRCSALRTFHGRYRLVLLEDLTHQSSTPAIQPLASRHLQHQRGIYPSHQRAELQRPPGQRSGGIHQRLARANRLRRGLQCNPVHGLRREVLSLPADAPAPVKLPVMGWRAPAAGHGA